MGKVVFFVSGPVDIALNSNLNLQTANQDLAVSHIGLFGCSSLVVVSDTTMQ